MVRAWMRVMCENFIPSSPSARRVGSLSGSASKLLLLRMDAVAADAPRCIASLAAAPASSSRSSSVGSYVSTSTCFFFFFRTAFSRFPAPPAQ